LTDEFSHRRAYCGGELVNVVVGIPPDLQVRVHLNAILFDDGNVIAKGSASSS
jgi:hypothetical protein